MLAVAVAVAPGGARAALSCSTVYNTLMPCLGYVQSGGAVPRGCCTGIKRLVSAARTTPDRRAARVCLKNVAAGAAGGPCLTRAAGLPAALQDQPQRQLQLDRFDKLRPDRRSALQRTCDLSLVTLEGLKDVVSTETSGISFYYAYIVIQFCRCIIDEKHGELSWMCVLCNYMYYNRHHC
ncbi:hypothetical protein BRADI_2g22278v3 [Brachypodium distachyon]|uniref:Non-specific lipid-transfer protein n=1 Tax=Brachypodium distachyon TaxID=15368 RepID=A0A2K2D9V1_BRADI|nr:hypothetical protein BRADI_2g22278v3 [Brachypodium distachyon]